MGKTKAIKEAEFTAADGTTLTTLYNFDAFLTADLIVHTNGFRGQTTNHEGALLQEDSTPDTDIGTIDPKNHWAECVIATTGGFGTPAVIARGALESGGSGYQIHPAGHSTARALRRFDAGTPTFLASGVAGTPIVGDKLNIAIDGSSITGGLNGYGEISHTDATYSVGRPGITCQVATAAPMGDSFKAGNVSARIHDIGLSTRRRLHALARVMLKAHRPIIFVRNA